MTNLSKSAPPSEPRPTAEKLWKSWPNHPKWVGEFFLRAGMTLAQSDELDADVCNFARAYANQAAEPRRDEREAFEAWAIIERFAGHVSHKSVFFKRYAHGRYVSDELQACWEGWAARASAAPLPQPSAGQTEGE